MILLPVIERELRVAARSRQTYRNRFIAALGIIGVLLWVIYDQRYSPQSVLGDGIFDYIKHVALCLALVAGFFHTADCISEERREGTLGLLYLTDLRGLHVVVGKLVANSIPAFFALATIVPVLGIPFLLGGISPGELERASLILVNALWLSLAAGLLASALVKDDRAALLLTFGFVALPTMIAPFMDQAGFSSFWALNASRDTLYLAHKNDFWIAIAEQFALPFVYLLLASLRARMIWREKPPSAAGQKRLERLRVWAGGTSNQRKEWRTAMLEENPALWLACRRRERTALLWAILGIGLIWLTWMWFAEHRIDAILGTMTSVIFHWILKITFAFAACRALSEESRNGAFELLFTTDLSPRLLLRGHLAGLARSFGPAVAVVITFDLLWAAFGRSDNIFSPDMRPFLWGRALILLVDLTTIALYGMWLGYKTQRSGRATVRTLLFVIVLPNLAWVFLLVGRSSIGLIFLVFFVLDGALIAIAMHNLNALRERAAERFVASSARG
jgi:ABC-type transport system involved in cytochrome c biogenesis permease component